MDDKHRGRLLGAYHRVSKFRLDKMGCRHFMTTRTLTIDSRESSCVYCGIVVRYDIPNVNSLARRSRVEDSIKKQNDNINQEESHTNKGD